MTLVIAVLALGYRLFLYQQYYGWEESDYGNLAMINGVLESGFQQYDMNHLPMYYFLSAVLMKFVGSALIAGTMVSMGAGVLTVVLGFLLAKRIGGVRAGALSAVLLTIQPELALYSASTLREPVYALFVIGALLALSYERLFLASALAGGAFLTRMDALLIFAPVLLVHGLGRQSRGRSLAAAMLPLMVSVCAWSLYCQSEYQNYAFWEHSVAVNIETGGAQEEASFFAWATDGARISAALFFETLSSRIGIVFWLMLFVGLAITPWRRHGIRRTLSVACILLVGFWLAVGFFGQHEVGHNLYWKWLHGVMPPLIVLASCALWTVVDSLKKSLGPLAARFVLLIAVAQAGVVMAGETQSQLDQSAKVNKPQLDLAKWIERNAASSEVMILDNIPERWLSRKAHAYQLLSWTDIADCAVPDWNAGTLRSQKNRVAYFGHGCEPKPQSGSAGPSPMNRIEFSDFLEQMGIRYVLFFKEDWTKGPLVAPFLEGQEEVAVGDFTLNPLFHDRMDQIDGWVFYEVSASAP